MTRLRWNGPTDLEICIMSARSAQRTRRRRWRMGRDIAGEREMRRTHGRRVSGLEALVVEGEQRRLLLLPPFALRRSSERRSASRPAVFLLRSVSTALTGFGAGSAASFLF